MVCEFPAVFPDDLWELPPPREMKLAIELMPGIRHTHMALCSLALAELKELKTQLKDLFSKGFIRCSTSLWNTLFVARKMNRCGCASIIAN